MQSISKQSWLITITMLSLSAMAAVAAPLPAGTTLGITQGVGSGPNLPCASGSCFSMEVSPGFVIWTDFGGGTDAGFIIGKAQACGSQEIEPSPSNTTPSQLTTAWYFFNNYGTFCTDPDGGQNIFDDTSCVGAGCIGKTELKYLYAVWNGNKIPLGSSVGCVDPNCSADQKAGVFVADYQINLGATGAWSMEYRQVVPSGPFLGVKFQVKYRGARICEGPPPYAEVGNINLIAPTGATVVWVPIVQTFVSCGSYLVTCRIITPPANGTATIASDCSSGNYQSERGFIGIDSFTYVANNGAYDSYPPGTVTVAVVDASPTPTYTALPTASLTTSPTYSPTFTSTASPTPTVTPPVECRDMHPVTQVSSLGKQGTLSITFTGNIVSSTNKEIKICPGTTLSYTASSTKDVVQCKVKNSLGTGSGTLRIRDHLKCTDKPGGKDKVQFKVKSGVTK
jgi:hypothetical protein